MLTAPRNSVLAEIDDMIDAMNELEDLDLCRDWLDYHGWLGPRDAAALSGALRNYEEGKKPCTSRSETSTIEISTPES